MGAKNVIEASGAFGRATGIMALQNQDAILGVYSKLENRSYSNEAKLGYTGPSAPAM